MTTLITTRDDQYRDVSGNREIFVNYSEALVLLQADPNTELYLVERDATGYWWQHHGVWLEDGEVVRAHPTDPSRGAILAPLYGRFAQASAQADD